MSANRIGEHVDVYPSAPPEPLSVDEIMDTAGPVHGTPVATPQPARITRIPLDIVVTANGDRTADVVVAVLVAELDALEAELAEAQRRAKADECRYDCRAAWRPTVSVP